MPMSYELCAELRAELQRCAHRGRRLAGRVEQMHNWMVAARRLLKSIDPKDIPAHQAVIRKQLIAGAEPLVAGVSEHEVSQ